METSLRRPVELIEGIGILMGPVIWSLAPRLALSAVTVDASKPKKKNALCCKRTLKSFPMFARSIKTQVISLVECDILHEPVPRELTEPGLHH
jgi:hypothetical protein